MQIMVEHYPNPGKFLSLYQTDTSNSNDSECVVASDGTVGVIASAGGSSGGGGSVFSTSVKVPLQKWTTVAIVCEIGKLSVYVDDTCAVTFADTSVSPDGRSDPDGYLRGGDCGSLLCLR